MKRLFALILSILLVVPIIPAYAKDMPSEVLLGIFFTSDEDQTDTLYVSFDGERFERIATVLEDMNKKSSKDNDTKLEKNYQVNCLHDPALQYHDGVYWTMSGWTRRKEIDNGNGTTKTVADKYVPMLSWSKDLVTWSYPNVGSADGNYDPTAGVVVPQNQLPMDKNGNWGNENYDAVAPELFIDDDGSAWIVVTMGYYASWHGDSPSNDKMSPYMIRCTKFGTGYGRADQPRITYSDAKRINLPEYGKEGEDNRIDAHIYKENNTYYLSIKLNGITNEIWSIKNLNDFADTSKWTLVCDNAVTGYEGPSLVKFNGKYYMYTDKLSDYPPNTNDRTTGVFVTESNLLQRGWGKTRRIRTQDEDGKIINNRHGSVYCITDKEQIKKIINLYREKGYKGSTEIPTYPEFGFWTNGVKKYWFEGGQIQGVYGDPKNIRDINYGHLERGREICDPTPNAWYWLDAVYGGAAAFGKEVWMPYIYQDEDKWGDAEIRQNANRADDGMKEFVYQCMKNKTGKWVRYDKEGKMLKGWVEIKGELAELYPKQKGNVYYYDTFTGLMAKGWLTIGGKKCHFDETTGVLLN